MLNLKDGLKQYQLQYSDTTPFAKIMRKILVQAAESYSIWWTESKGVKTTFGQYYDFHIYCDKTNFAQAYSHIGILRGLHLVPKYHAKFKSKPRKLKSKK